MEKTQYSLAWDGYHPNMCAGFSLLQQNGEMVDLTLAADGRLVKVHKLVLGIASPYLKQLIQSADCTHPVIFLNKVSYKTLCCLLEYVYTGEVLVEEDNFTDFFEAAKTLKIQGLVDDMFHALVSSDEQKQKESEAKPFQVYSMAAKEVSQTPEMRTSGRNAQLKRKSTSATSPERDAKRFQIKEEVSVSFSDDEAGSGGSNDDDNLPHDYECLEPEDTKGLEDAKQSNDGNKSKPVCDFQYTVSNRGALQIILNRFMYNISSRRDGGRVRLWRCVDYRNHGCPAAVVTENDMVVKRTNLHCHPFHDKRILSKVERRAVYSAIRSEKNEFRAIESTLIKE